MQTTALRRTAAVAAFYVQGPHGSIEIDLDRGLGQFLVRSRCLEQRILLRPDEHLEIEPGKTYTRYAFDARRFRFNADISFSSLTAVVDEDEEMIHVVAGPHAGRYPYEFFGIESRDACDITVFLTTGGRAP
jgi:hypothetical protein